MEIILKKVIVVMSLLAAGTLSGAYELYKLVPEPVATSVIAEKPEPGKAGGQAAVLLPSHLTSKQSHLLGLAHKFAKAEGLQPEIVQSVLLQETNAGGMKAYKVANPGPDAYFGPMQLKLSATRDVLKRSPGLFAKYGFHTKTDDEIKANLILNEQFNLEVGTKYIKLLRDTYGFSGRRLMNAYNRGPGGVNGVDDNFHYAIGAESKLASMKAKGQRL